MSFEKGKSGNPRGRPKSNIGALIREKTNDGQIIVDEVLRILKHTKSDAIRIHAAEFLRDTGFGKPTQSHEHSGPEGGEIVVRQIKFGGN